MHYPCLSTGIPETFPESLRSGCMSIFSHSNGKQPLVLQKILLCELCLLAAWRLIDKTEHQEDGGDKQWYLEVTEELRCQRMGLQRSRSTCCRKVPRTHWSKQKKMSVPSMGQPHCQIWVMHSKNRSFHPLLGPHRDVLNVWSPVWRA